MPATAYPAVRRRRAERFTKLQALGYRDYADYLRSPHWRSLKAHYRASSQPQECICGETRGLHLHHLTYERIGAEQLVDLTLLCPTCHAMVHELERRGEMGLDFAGLVNMKRAERNRAEQDARAAQRFRDHEDHERLQFRRDVPIERRLANLRRIAKERHIDVRSDIRAIERRLQAIERKLRHCE